MDHVNEQTAHYLKTGGFVVASQTDHLLCTHLDSKLLVRVFPADTPNDVVNKLIVAARKFP